MENRCFSIKASVIRIPLAAYTYDYFLNFHPHSHHITNVHLFMTKPKKHPFSTIITTSSSTPQRSLTSLISILSFRFTLYRLSCNNCAKQKTKTIYRLVGRVDRLSNVEGYRRVRNHAAKSILHCLRTEITNGILFF